MFFGALRETFDTARAFRDDPPPQDEFAGHRAKLRGDAEAPYGAASTIDLVFVLDRTGKSEGSLEILIGEKRVRKRGEERTSAPRPQTSALLRLGWRFVSPCAVAKQSASPGADV